MAIALGDPPHIIIITRRGRVSDNDKNNKITEIKLNTKQHEISSEQHFRPSRLPRTPFSEPRNYTE